MPSEVYTVRQGLFDIGLLGPESIVSLYKAELTKAGFVTSQLPVVIWPKPQVKVTANDPFPGARTISVSVPPFGSFDQTRDTNVPYSEDPAKLAQAGKAFASIFVWNLCSDRPMEESLGALRDIFRKVKVEGSLKLSPKVSKWADAPVKLDGYPDRPERPECGAAPVSKTVKKAGKGLLWGSIAAWALWALSKGKI